MSNIAETHTVVEYISGVTKPLSGQRLSTHSWKTVKSDNGTEYKRPSVCVSLPRVEAKEVVENVGLLSGVIVSYLEEVQNKMVREKLNETAHGEYVHVTEDSVSIAAMVEYLESSNESGRITKEAVVEWFDASIEEALMLQLSEKLGCSDIPTDAESAKIEAIVSEFRTKISGLAGGKTSYPIQIAKQLKKAVELVESNDDVLKDRFLVRLDKMMLAPVENDLLGAL